MCSESQLADSLARASDRDLPRVGPQAPDLARPVHGRQRLELAEWRREANQNFHRQNVQAVSTRVRQGKSSVDRRSPNTIPATTTAVAPNAPMPSEQNCSLNSAPRCPPPFSVFFVKCSAVSLPSEAPQFLQLRLAYRVNKTTPSSVSLVGSSRITRRR